MSPMLFKHGLMGFETPWQDLLGSVAQWIEQLPLQFQELVIPRYKSWNAGALVWNIRKLVKKGQYIYAVVPEHPMAIDHGYVLEHRVRMENHLKRLLNANEVVHHKDGNKHNNGIENLEVMLNSKHTTEHNSMRGRKVVVFCCPSCGTIFERRKGAIQSSKPKIFVACSCRCRGKFSRRIQLEGRTREVEAAISVNIVREYRYFPDNTEETVDAGSVETVRGSSEMTKIQSSPQQGDKTLV